MRRGIASLASRAFAVVVALVCMMCICLAPARAEEVQDVGEAVALEKSTAIEVLESEDEEPLLEAQSTAQSGLSSSQKPSMASLRARYAALPAYPTGDSLWSVLPNVGSYKAGTLSSNSLKYAKAYLGLVRYAANLGQIGFDTSLNASASQGALILARLDSGLTHYPSTPSGVSDALAQPGKDACATSNISSSRISSGYVDVLGKAIQGQMDDKSLGNMATLGHRRWLLHPYTTTMGIGSARGESNTYYTAIRVMGDGIGEDASVDYDYVAWPPSGAMLSELFQVGVPWSITLNPNKYAAPSLSNVTVTLTRKADGRSWTLNKSDNTATTTGEYFNVNNDWYAINNCIVFNPGSNNLGTATYEGGYVVRVSGLKTRSGSSATLEYEVNFAGAVGDLSAAGKIADISNQAYTGSAVCPSVEVRVDGEVLTPNVDYTVQYKNNVKEGTATVIVSGKGAYTGSISKTFRIVKDGWVDLGGGKKGYMKNGKLVKGWLELNGAKYWFDANGVMATGWRDLGTSKYYFQPDGRMSVGWTDVTDSAGKTLHYYFNPNSGNLVRGTWFEIDGYKYYFRPSGNVAHGWATITDNGVDKKYYFDDDYHMVTGWQDIANSEGRDIRYYFRPSGSMATGWATIDGQKYWFRASGSMAKGFNTVDDGYKRYFDHNGHMLVGWQQIDGKTFYFRSPSGAMQTGKATIDGKTYEFTASGTLKS